MKNALIIVLGVMVVCLSLALIEERQCKARKVPYIIHERAMT